MMIPSLLAIDIGNSRIHCGLFRNGALERNWYHDTYQANECIKEVLIAAGGIPIGVSSVVPQVSMLVREYCQLAGNQLIEVSIDKQNVIQGAYPTLGTDRLSNLAAALTIWGNTLPLLVIDLGTATTLSAITPEGRFAGGFISPGLGTMLSCMHQQTAQLPAVEPGAFTPESLKMAMDTEHAIFNGIVLSQSGTIEAWVNEAQQELGKDCLTIATGGWAKLISGLIQFDHVDQLLTLKGIYFLACHYPSESSLKHFSSS